MGSDFPAVTPANDNPFAPERTLSTTQSSDNGLPALPETGNDGARYYTIQRVNGNGANGKGDGTAGAHKHSIEESDKVKKSSLHRHFLKKEKERRKSMVSKHSVFSLPLLATRPQGGKRSRPASITLACSSDLGCTSLNWRSVCEVHILYILSAISNASQNLFETHILYH